MRRFYVILLGCLVAAVGLTYVFYTELRPTVIFGLRDDYARAIPYQHTPEGIESLRAEHCGTCHREIYDEWRTSFHARAYEDPFFQSLSQFQLLQWQPYHPR